MKETGQKKGWLILKLILAVFITAPVLYASTGVVKVPAMGYGLLPMEYLAEDSENGIQVLENQTPILQDKLIDAEDVDEVYSLSQSILENADAAFLGNHPIDEGFLFRFSSMYGKDALKAVASDFSDSDIWYRVTGNSIHVLYDDYCRDTGISLEKAKRTKYSGTGKEKSVKLLFSGDIAFAEGLATTKYMDICEDGLFDCFSADILDLMKNADLFTVNNEFAYTDCLVPVPDKAYTFRADEKRVTELSKIGADLVSLANNHVCDYGEEGLLDTLDALHDNGFATIGAGRDIDEASEPYSLIAGGRKITVLSATQIERTLFFTKEATEDSPGVLKTLYPEYFASVIKKAKKISDFVVVYVHWGTEGDLRFGKDQELLAEEFVKAGADAIIGGHTHCLQGMEFFGDVPCLYSLGNFWFATSDRMPDSYYTGLCEIEVTPDNELITRFVPCEFSNGVTSIIIDGNKRREVFDMLERISRDILIDDNGTISKSMK